MARSGLAMALGALTRYDGTNFTHFTARDGVPKGPIVAVHATPSGSIWLTTTEGPPCRYDGRSFVRFTEQGRVKANGFLKSKPARMAPPGLAR